LYSKSPISWIAPCQHPGRRRHHIDRNPNSALGLATLNVFAGAGNSTINVQATPTGVTTNIDTGGGTNNIVNVGSDPGTPSLSTLGSIQSLVSVTDPTGVTTLNILDAGDTAISVDGSQPPAAQSPVMNVPARQAPLQAWPRARSPSTRPKRFFFEVGSPR